VDVILAYEAWTATDEFRDAVIEWMTQDAESVEYATSRFHVSADADKAFERWLDTRGDQ
jgi:hypothetical protein